MQAFVDQSPGQVAQQITFIRQHYAQITARKNQLDCYERFQKIGTGTGTGTFVTVPKDSAQHLYGQEPFNAPVYFYMGDSLYGSLPRVLFYQNGNDIELIEEYTYDTTEGSYSESTEYYFLKEQLLFVFHHYESIDFWTKHDEGLEKQARQYRYYFLENRPLRCLKKTYRGFEDASVMIAHQANDTLLSDRGLPVLHQAHKLLASVTGNEAYQD